MSKEGIILLGGGGHCKSVIDVIESAGEFEIKGILDLPDLVGEEILGYKIIGTDEDIPKYAEEVGNFCVTVGQIKDNELRKRLFKLVEEAKGQLPVIRSSRSWVSRFSTVGKGTWIGHDVIVNAGATIGMNCILNSKCLIEHGTRIGDHTHVSTAAIVNGECNIGHDCFIGSAAMISNNISIGDRTLIGAASVVIKNVDADMVDLRITKYSDECEMTEPVIIIAEAGVNHNGEIELAEKLVSAAAASGADIIKFQTFNAEELVSSSAEKADYQVDQTDLESGQLDMLQKLELSEEDHLRLSDLARSKGIRFLSTPFGESSVDLLEKFDIPFFKIPSGELTNAPLLKYIASRGKPVVMSTGMAEQEEIKDAIDVLTGNGMDLEDITLLKCTTDYPTPFSDANLAGMETLKRTFKTKVGYSDHTLGIEVPIAAVAMGACIIEKHITLDRNMPGPDHAASIEPNELTRMVQAIRNIEQAIGSEEIRPTDVELKNRTAARRSIHSARPIEKGHIIGSADLTMKRPGNGISPMQADELIGKRAKLDMERDRMLKWEDLE